MCTPFETFPVTVEDGVGLDGGAIGAEDEDGELGVGLGVVLGEAPAPEGASEPEVAIAATCDKADFPALSE